ncbi:protein MAIN-LIKE 1-like [Coffea arabica]|uniref:Protein MAIN-LIKE 1-like n=1 Tax=Coffea arabica TaxID=13443 RepID=A0ABM4W7S9_COFAR
MESPRRVQQMLVVPPEVQRWPTLLSPNEVNQIADRLGHIGDFKDIKSDGYLVEALVHLWDPTCSSFRVGKREMTITIEEVAGFLNLPIQGTAVVLPLVSNKVEFCRFTGLKESVLQGADQNIEAKFLFDRFALRDGFERHRGDFSFTSKEAWDRKRVWVYGLVMTGTYFFPRKDKKIAFKLTRILYDLFLGINGRPCSIIPTILADIFIACTTCQKGKKFFCGSNLILHIWGMEHFMRRPAISSSLPMFAYNWITTHHKRINRDSFPRNAAEFVDFLKNLTDQNIRWVLDWTDCTKPVLRTQASEFILLLGTQGITAYVPKRFLRQLGRTQEIPPVFDMSEVTIIFNWGMCPNQIPMKDRIIDAWVTLSDDVSFRYIPELQQKGLKTPQYEDWVTKFATSGQLDGPVEEIERLKAIIELKDREVLQLKQSVEVHKGKAEENKRLYEEERERRQEMKRKCGELYDQAERVKRPYARETKDSVLDRLKNFGDLVRNRLRDMM